MVELHGECLSIRWATRSRSSEFLTVESVYDIVDPRLTIAIVPEVIDELPSASISDDGETIVEAGGSHDLLERGATIINGRHFHTYWIFH